MKRAGEIVEDLRIVDKEPEERERELEYVIRARVITEIGKNLLEEQLGMNKRIQKEIKEIRRNRLCKFLRSYRHGTVQKGIR